MTWYVYMARCADQTFYTGITTNTKRRVAQHNGQSPGKGAAYTAARRPVALVYRERAVDRSRATAREHALRKLSRSHKETLARAWRERE